MNQKISIAKLLESKIINLSIFLFKKKIYKSFNILAVKIIKCSKIAIFKI